MRVVSERDQDEALAEAICRDARDNPASPYAGKYVGILGGEVVIVADTPEEGLEELRKREPDPERGLLIDTSIDRDEIIEIWSG